MPSTSTVRFPNETAAYRDAREELLAAETELRRKIEEVAALRRRLPAGGAVPEDYEFDEIMVDPSGAERLRPIRLSGLFAPGQPTLLVYSYMYGPEMATPCNMCTSILDGLDGEVPHIRDRVSFAVVAKSPIERVRQVARERGWRNLRFYQAIDDDFIRDTHWLAGGSEGAGVFVWTRDGAEARLFWAAEGGPETADPGFYPHLAPDPTPLWNVLDWTPEGRDPAWYPKLEY
jgi:predicted dithiol-disulfide oxidoreductase (DUF899 family)